MTYAVDYSDRPRMGKLHSCWASAGLTTGAVPADHRADGVAGALGSGAQVSFAIRNFYTFWVHVIPFFGGFIADCYLGRYKTILYSSFVCL